MNSRVCVSAIIEKDGKILLGRKPENVSPYPNTWLLPGGGVELENESLIDAVKREAKEETGLEITDIEQISFDEDNEPNKNGEMTHYLFLVFKAKLVSDKSVPTDNEFVKLQWFSKEELKNVDLSRPTVKLFKKIGLI
jgi:8-oxo-dGTP pyrophosphatase MutT (NUDIX family)